MGAWGTSAVSGRVKPLEQASFKPQMEGSQSAAGDSSPACFGFDHLANRLVQLLETATREFERDREAAKASLVTASTLLQAEVERYSSAHGSIRSLVLNLPQTNLDALVDDAKVSRFAELACDPGVGVSDEVSWRFMDHLTLALGAHIAQAYGGTQPHSSPTQGGLAPWQEKRSKDMLASDLAGATPLSEIAEACHLSVSHFSRAFRRSTGLPPHAWLLHIRVEAAKAMLRQREAQLSVIALACGFADQSHFTRVFTRRVGVSPGAWRRSVAG